MPETHDDSAIDGLDGLDDLMSGYDAEVNDWEAIQQQDEKNIQAALSGVGESGKLDVLENFQDKDIDQASKADDAIDFENMSDDDLASDDDLPSPTVPQLDASQVPGLTEDSGDSHEVEMDLNADVDLDDLFGDDGANIANVVLPPSSPPLDTQTASATQPSDMPDDGLLALPQADGLSQSESQKLPAPAADVTDDDWNTMSFEEKFRLNFPQEEPNSVSAWITDQTQHQDPSVPIPPQNVDELVKQKFPSFEEHKTLNFRELFPEWPAHYSYKDPTKDPAACLPSKLELEIEADTAKLFRIADTALAANAKRSQQQYWQQEEERTLGPAPVLMDLEEMFPDSEDEDEKVGGFSLAELSTLCDDWEHISDPYVSMRQNGPLTPPAEEPKEMDEWDKQFLEDRKTQITKKRKYEPGLPTIVSYPTHGLDNFGDMTRRLAGNVYLPKDDPYLLLEDPQVQRPTKRQRIEEKMKRMANGQFGRDVVHRFNHSNDAAYEALKANHKNKVRATLSNLTVEHGMPAQKLAFPYYRTKLHGEFWEHHRPKFDVAKLLKYQVRFRRQAKVKRKEMKGKSVPEIYKTSRDLTLNDNSTVILFEYSEQTPILLNKFGMGSRVVNYTRRKEGEDEDKLPKAELGENHHLLPEDRSPFSIFGTVDPGEVVPTLHNALFRAPIFKHNQRSTDFILGYSTTSGVEAPFYYLKKAQGLQTVGQQNYYMEVPGPHARKITSANKTRTRAVCDRMARKRPNRDIDIRDVTPHVFEKVDPQNRQKMKESYVYNKETKTWGYKEGDAPWDEPMIRQKLKPEDAVLIEATHVGSATLQSAGYDPKAQSFHDDDDELGADIPLVAKLAPWEITKNFLEACAGKAMVALHGEGDPTGCGLGFSFIKTSMKGGYISAVQGPLATSADAMERERKANGGHSYNVKKQQEMYTAAIKHIWDKQKDTLSDATTYEDADLLDTANEDDRFANKQKIDHTPAPQNDDGRSQLSRFSQNSRAGRRKLRIVRKKRLENGRVENEVVIVEDQQVIRSYLKQRRDNDAAARDIYSLKPTGDADVDRQTAKILDQELIRLEKNADRRIVREKQGKGKKRKQIVDGDAASPDPSSSADKAAGGTTRKCANCGQVGHIKTNKSKCPLLNGTISTGGDANDRGGFGAFGAPAVGSTASDAA